MEPDTVGCVVRRSSAASLKSASKSEVVGGKIQTVLVSSASREDSSDQSNCRTSNLRLNLASMSPSTLTLDLKPQDHNDSNNKLDNESKALSDAGSERETWDKKTGTVKCDIPWMQNNC